MKLRGRLEVEIHFRTRRLSRTLSSERETQREYGEDMAAVIKLRLDLLSKAPSLTQVTTGRPERRHLLSGRRRGQYAIDLVHPYRLIFAPYHDPIPRLRDGGVDTDEVTAITVLEIVDYH